MDPHVDLYHTDYMATVALVEIQGRQQPFGNDFHYHFLELMSESLLLLPLRTIRSGGAG